MARKASEIIVRVEIDYDKLRDAIRDAMRSSVTFHTTGLTAPSASELVQRMAEEVTWREAERIVRAGE